MRFSVQDFRDAWRALRRSPGASVAALVTLAVGLGVSFAIFNALYAALWQPLPYPHSGELLSIQETLDAHPGIMASPGDMRALAQQSQAISAIGLYHLWPSVITNHGPATQKDVLTVNPASFRVLGMAPARGRAFTAADTHSGAAPVMMLSAAFARKRFGAEPAVGQTLNVDGAPHRIVGITAPGFTAFLGQGDDTGVFVPLPADAMAQAYMYGAIARLRPGITPAAAAAEARAIAARQLPRHPHMKSLAFAFTGLAASLHRYMRVTPWLLLGTAALILLLACVNVASLLLARITGRRRELAIRQALGAGRGNLVRPVLAEGLILGTAGGLAAWWLAWLLLHLLAGLHPPSWLTATSSATVAPLGFAVVVSLGAGMICSLIPAWNAVRGLATPGGSATLAPHRLRGGVIALEVAVALVLAVSAGLLIHTLERLQSVPVGFNADHVLTAQVMVPQTQASPATSLFYTHLLGQVRSLPAVQSAALCNVLPFYGGMFAGAKLAGHSEFLQASLISPGFLHTMQIALLQGRAFAATDTANAPHVVIVNQKLASAWWPGQNPIGKRFTLSDKKHSGPWTVVGLAHDIHQESYQQAAKPQAFFPLAQYPMSGLSMVLRTTGDPDALSQPLQHLVAAAAPEAVATVESMTGLLRDDVASQRFLMILLELAAGLALALAALGVYGTVSYWVSQRTQEVGVRMALGAAQRHVLGLVLGRTLRWAMVGALVGAGAAYAAGRGLATMLFQVKPDDPPSLAAGIAILLAAALLAAWLPARRAARVDPVQALRHE